MSSAIHEAINTLSLDALRKALADEPDSANTIHEGLTPLMLLAGKKPQIEDYERLKNLGLANRDTTEQVVRNRTLHIYETMAKFIAVSPAVELNVAGSDGRTALHMAAELNNEDLLNVLIDGGADLNKQDDQGRTPLMVASTFTIRRILTYAGADLTAQDLAGNTVLHLLLQQGTHDPSSTALISKALPDLLHVKNKEGLTPDELAQQAATTANERYARYAEQELTRRKAAWEESFEAGDNECSASDVMSDMAGSCVNKEDEEEVQVKVESTVSCWKQFWSFFTSCCCRRAAPQTPTSQQEVAAPRHQMSTVSNAMYVTKDMLLNGTKFVSGPEEPIQKRERKAIVIDEFKYINNEIAAAHVPQEQERTEFSAPLHRQSNFTTEETELSAFQKQIEQQRRELDEVFQILNQTPQQNPPPTATAEPPHSLPPEVGLPSEPRQIPEQPQSEDAAPAAESAEH